jgi:hypothetical protein
LESYLSRTAAHVRIETHGNRCLVKRLELKFLLYPPLPTLASLGKHNSKRNRGRSKLRARSHTEQGCGSSQFQGGCYTSGLKICAPCMDSRKIGSSCLQESGPSAVLVQRLRFPQTGNNSSHVRQRDMSKYRRWRACAYALPM